MNGLDIGTFLKKGYNHRVVNHQRHFVSKGISTQSIEGFWSLLKRGIIGIYHHVSEKWLPQYLAEFEFRYNHRDKDNLFDMVLAKI